MEWRDEFSVGVAALDDDHKRLVSIITRLGEAKEKGDSVLWVLEELDEYAASHFRREEQMMESAGCPDLEIHRTEHKNFLDRVKSMTVTFGLEPEAQFHLGDAVDAFLRDWLASHILKTDMKYKGLIRG